MYFVMQGTVYGLYLCIVNKAKNNNYYTHMKTFIKSLALALTLGVVSFANVLAAPEKPGKKSKVESFATYQTAVYPSTSQSVINVMLEKGEGGPVHISFKNKAGETMAVQTVGRNKDRVSMKFRIDELPDGQYSVEVSNGRDVTSKQITIATRPEASPRTIVLQ